MLCWNLSKAFSFSQRKIYEFFSQTSSNGKGIIYFGSFFAVTPQTIYLTFFTPYGGLGT